MKQMLKMTLLLCLTQASFANVCSEVEVSAQIAYEELDYQATLAKAKYMTFPGMNNPQDACARLDEFYMVYMDYQKSAQYTNQKALNYYKQCSNNSAVKQLMSKVDEALDMSEMYLEDLDLFDDFAGCWEVLD